MPTHEQAKGFQRDPGGVGQALENLDPTLEGLSLLLTREVAASLERGLARVKASAVGAVVDRGKSTVYKWAAEGRDIPVSALGALAHFDPDPDFLTRLGAHLLSTAAALAKKRAGERRVFIVEEVGPGRMVRR